MVLAFVLTLTSKVVASGQQTSSGSSPAKCQDIFSTATTRTKASLFSPAELAGAKYLSKKDPQLHLASEVQMARDRAQAKNPDVYIQKSAEVKIASWMRQLENTHGRFEENSKIFQRMMNYYSQKYVIKSEDIPEEYFDLQKRIAREQGHGDIQITDEMRKQQIEILIRDQRASLEEWMTYLSSQETSHYPIWAKYWVFQGMLQLGVYTAEEVRFGKRTKRTVAPFAEIHRDSLAKIMEWMQWKVMADHQKDQDSKMQNKIPLELKQDADAYHLVQRGNFGELYAYAIKKYGTQDPSLWPEVEGRWVKYKQGSDAKALVNSLQGYGTGWCTAAEPTAKTQLAAGDFYVYYSKDPQGQYQIPRAAIRMANKKIAEVRGVAQQQNLDPYIAEVVNKKMEEFPDGKEYQKKASDMKRLTLIESKQKKNELLTKEDLRFLYEIDGNIEGFGFKKDPRLEEIKKLRNLKEDYAEIFDCESHEVSFTLEEAQSGRFKVHIGDLDLRWITNTNELRGFASLKVFRGDLNLNGLQSAEGLILPTEFQGDLNLNGLQSAKGLVLPERFQGDLNLIGLQSAKGLVLPERFQGDLHLMRLQSAEGLILPTEFQGDLNLMGLQSAKGLVLPERFQGDLDLMRLQSAKGLVFPKEFQGDLNLMGLQSAKDLFLPERFQGYLSLGGLKSAKGLILPTEFQGKLNLMGLQSAQGLVLPERFQGDLNLMGLQSAKGLVLPKEFQGKLFLNGLKSVDGLGLLKEFQVALYLRGLRFADGLVLPERFQGDLNLMGLQSAKGLVLPTEFQGELDLDGLQSAEGLVLPERFQGTLSLGGLKSAKGLILPTGFQGDLNLKGLQSAEGLFLPERFQGKLNLDGLQSAKGLVLPKEFQGYLSLDGLHSAEGLVLPERFQGNLNLMGLQSAKGLVLPERFQGDLNLKGLQSAEGLVLPTKFQGFLYLNGLKSAEGLVLPTEFQGTLSLVGLKSAKGLVLPERFQGDLYLNGLQSAEGLFIPERFQGKLNLDGLKSAEGLVLLERFQGFLYLDGLQSAENLVLPKEFQGALLLRGLQSAKGLVLPEKFQGTLHIKAKAAAGFRRPEGMQLHIYD